MKDPNHTACSVRLSLLVLSCWMGFVFLSEAQKPNAFIKGQVTDANTGKSLPFVHIVVRNTGFGVVSDLNGNYSLWINQLPEIVVASCIGYETQQIEIKSNPASDLDIILVPKVTMLSEVTIKAGKLEVVCKSDHYSVLDYELKGDLIYLLIFRNRLSKSELLVLNAWGDTLSRLANLPRDPVGFYKDCLDTVHLITDNIAYQLFLESDRISLKFPVETSEFSQIFENCITSLNDFLFMRQYTADQLSLLYFGVSKIDGQIRKMAFIEDEFKLNLLRKNPSDRAVFASGPVEGTSFIGDGEMGIPDIEDYSPLRHEQAFKLFARNAFYSPVKAPLKRIDENLAIFDFSNSKIRFYDPSCNPVYEVPITFHRVDTDRNIFKGIFDTREWNEYQILVDEARFKAYALFITGGLYELKEIDLFSGKLTTSHQLAFPYPEKITVNDGHVYFLYKPMSDWTKKRLYRQKL